MSDPSQQNGFVPLEKADFSRPPPTNVFHQAPVFYIFNNASQSSNNLMLPPSNGYAVPQLQQNRTLGARPEVLGAVPQFQGRNDVWPQWLPAMTQHQIQNPARPVWPQLFPATWNDGSKPLPQVQDPRWAQQGEALKSRVVDIQEVLHEQHQPLPAICWKTNETAPLRRSARNASATASRKATQNNEEVPKRQMREVKKSKTTVCKRSAPTEESSEEEEEDGDEKANVKAPQPTRRKQTVESDTSNESEPDDLGRFMDGDEDLSSDEFPSKKKISRANQKKQVQKVERRQAQEAARGKKKRAAALSDSDSEFEKEARKTREKGKKKAKEVKEETEPKFFVPKRGKSARK